MSFAVTPKLKGDEEKVATAIKRLAEEDPTLRLRRDPQTGEEILAGMSQMHVEVALERAKRRFGVDVELHQPRVPYLETIRKESRARHRYKKQTGGRGQFGDCEIVLEPIDGHQGYEFVDKIVGGVIPQSFRPAVDKGIQEAMQHGELAGAPVQGVRVRLVDGQYHNVDSSEMAFKIAGSMAFKEAYAKADPVLLEPIMELEVTVPDEAVGAVNGDLNSRRGRLNGMEPAGGMTHDPRRGADGGDPHVLAVADVDDGRSRRLRDASPPLRAGAGARRPEDRRRDAEGPGRGQRIAVPACVVHTLWKVGAAVIVAVPCGSRSPMSRGSVRSASERSSWASTRSASRPTGRSSSTCARSAARSRSTTDGCVRGMPSRRRSSSRPGNAVRRRCGRRFSGHAKRRPSRSSPSRSSGASPTTSSRSWRPPTCSTSRRSGGRSPASRGASVSRRSRSCPFPGSTPRRC